MNSFATNNFEVLMDMIDVLKRAEYDQILLTIDEPGREDSYISVDWLKREFGTHFSEEEF